MKPFVVVKVEIVPYALSCILDSLIVMDIYLIILEGPPGSLDKDIIKYPSSPIHAYKYDICGECVGKLPAGKLRPIDNSHERTYRERQSIITAR